ncbi:MAG: hypothetical protein PHY83_03160 [Bacilli bacterium]|nr:hypothetical protein [Bacilli bacterium]
MLKTLGKYKKEIQVVEDDVTYTLPLTYPKLKNSIYFWDTVYAITDLYEKTKDNPELNMVTSIKASREVLEPLSNYIYCCIENEETRQLTDDEKDFINILILKNYHKIITEFSELFGALFKGDDSKK